MHPPSGAPHTGIMAAMSDLDGFSSKLAAILQADLKQAALAAGPLEVPALANIAQLWNVMGASASNAPGGGGDIHNNNNNNNATALGNLSAAASGLGTSAAGVSPEVNAMLRSLREQQEQVALLDRMQNIRVKNIQDEYQRFMERVRAKAQTAIDQANSQYSQERGQLIAKLEGVIAYVTQQQQAAVVAAQQAALAAVMKPADVTSAAAAAAAAAGPNPIGLLSQSMAQQLLAMQANVAVNAAVAGTKPTGAPTTTTPANNSTNPTAAALLALPQMAAVMSNHPLAPIMATMGQLSTMSEPDILTQLEQIDKVSKNAGSGQQPLDAALAAHIALVQTALRHQLQQIRTAGGRGGAGGNAGTVQGNTAAGTPINLNFE